MVGPDIGIGTLQVLRGTPSHPVIVVTTLTNDDESPRPPQGWGLCGVCIQFYSFASFAY